MENVYVKKAIIILWKIKNVKVKIYNKNIFIFIFIFYFLFKNALLNASCELEFGEIVCNTCIDEK